MRFIVMAAVLSTGCWIFPANECTPFAQRCSGSLVQTCNSDKRWFQTNDCSQVEPRSMNWECQTREDGTAACLPRDGGR